MSAQFSLQPDLVGPLYRQVYETLRRAIIDGSLKENQRLPASRELASQLGVSRNTINNAYDLLQAEGYVQAKVGSGYYVVEIPQKLRQVAPSQTHEAAIDESALSQRGQQMAAPTRPTPTINNPAFQPGLPDLAQFPYRPWQQCLSAAVRAMNSELMLYQDQGGLTALKQALRDYLRMSRGVKCDAEQIIIVNGSQAGLDLIARLCVNPGETIAVENPGYLGARDGFVSAGAALLPFAVDEHGLCVEELRKASATADIGLVYTTPSYQFPSGVIMSARRRMELLQWATDQQAFIIEDDYDSEFRYRGHPLSSLQGLDNQDRVIYLGTFSKVMFPGLRLGYIVVPNLLARAFANALRKTGQDAPLLLQAAMAEFINSGHFDSHLRRIRKLYGAKQSRFVTLAHQHLDDCLEVQATDAGMQLVAYYRYEVDEDKLLRLAAEHQLVLSCLSRYHLPRRHLFHCHPRRYPLSAAGKQTDSIVRPGLFIGYTGVALEHMEANIVALKTIVENARK